MTFIWYLIGILIGLFGIGSWILETYTDSPSPHYGEKWEEETRVKQVAHLLPLLSFQQAYSF